MNLPTNNQEEGTRANKYSRQDSQTYLTVDGEAWDVSNLLDSLPPEESKVNHNIKKKPPGPDDSFLKEERKLPASLAKKHNDGSNTVTLKPVPKYDWRSSPSASFQKEADESPEASSNDLQHDTSNNSYRFDQEQQQYDDDLQQAYESSLHQSDLMRSSSSPHQKHHLPKHQENNKKQYERSLLEVFPGVEMPLRGSVETQDAIARNFIANVHCMDCTLQIKCIRDAEYVLCPLCHCVSPMELSCSSYNALVSASAFGVGLGYCDDEL